MKFKNLIVLSTLLLVLFVGIGVTTANENTTVNTVELDTNNQITTDEVLKEYDTVEKSDKLQSYDLDDEYNAKIIVEDMTVEYSSTDYEITAYIEDMNHNPIENAEAYLDDYLNSEYDSDGYYHFFPMYLDAGTHKLEFTLDDGLYKAEPVTMNLKIVKSVFYGEIKCKAYYGTDKDTLTMKATIYDPDDDYYPDGYVTFKVNGKSYKVKTKDGVAIKKIKIKKVGTYTYTAKFTNENYKSSVTGKAKLYVYSTSKKARTFNLKGYKIVVPVTKYKKLVNAKNTKKGVSYELKTNKFIKQTYRHYYNGNKYVYKTVKARGIICISFGGKTGLQTAPPNKYALYLFTRYQGYDSFCKPTISGYKQTSEINKLNNFKLKTYGS